MKPDFYIIPEQIQSNDALRPTDWIVYAVVYWFEHMKDGKCIASNETIAKIAKVSPRAVIGALERLEKEAYITRQYFGEQNSRRASIHCTISFRRDEQTFTLPKKGEQTCKRARTNVHPQGRTNVHHISNINTSKREEENTAPQSGADVNKLIELFKEVNPSYERLFSNTSQRKALERLVKKHGIEKIERSIKFAVSVSGVEYAPTVTTPVQLESKLGDLVAYYKKKSAGKPKLVEV